MSATAKIETVKVTRAAKAAKIAVAKPAKREVLPRVSVTERNVAKAAARLLGGMKLVSTEISYVQRELGTTATQADLDAKIVAVRAMPWASIVVPD
jgi:hypothetical protein